MNKGFTFIEILVVIGIFIIVVSISVPVYGNWQSATQLEAAATDARQTLLLARARSLAGVNDAAHGVYFIIAPSGPDSMVLYQGNTYAARNESYDRTTSFPAAIELSAGRNEINFSQGLAQPTATGTLTILQNATNESREISVLETGMIE